MLPVLRSWVSWLFGGFVRSHGLTDVAAVTKAVKEIAAFEVGVELTENQQEWLARLFATLKRGQILCALREGPEGVSGINRAIAGILTATLNSSQVAHPKSFLDSAQSNRYFPGCPIMVTRNNRALNLYNGDTGIVLRGGGGLVAVFEEAGAFRHFPISELAETVPAFAITIHKSQGSEYENVLIVLPGQPDHPLMTREILYTAMTRTRNNAWFYARNACLKAAIARCTRRYSGLNLWPEV
jgi:exodeoxyribonuclease V alpha subunit